MGFGESRVGAGSEVNSHIYKLAMSFECDQCDKLFACRSNVLRHQINVHQRATSRTRNAVSSLLQPIGQLARAVAPPIASPSSSSSQALAPTQVQGPVAPLSLSTAQPSHWRICGSCGETFDRLVAKNAHAKMCEGKVAAMKIAQRQADVKELLTLWMDAPADADVDRNSFFDPEVLKDFAAFEEWLMSPAGYGSLGPHRAVNSRRTVQIVKEDMCYLISFMTPPSMAGFCDLETMKEVIRKVVAVGKTAGRMYNLLSTAEKVRPLHVPLHIINRTAAL